MPDVELAHDYIDRLRATANQTDHVDEEEELRDMAQLLERLTKRVEQSSGDRYQDRAKAVVRTYVDEHLDKSDPVPAFDVFVVWFAKTLGNWKALVSTTLPDGRYYEVTHNGATGETYLDAYVKLENQVIR